MIHERKHTVTIATRRRRRRCLTYAFFLAVLVVVGLMILPARHTACRIPASKGGYDRYLLYMPAGYRITPFKKWPLILFLHGSTERGTNVEDVRRLGLPAALDGGLRIPFLVVSPQIGPEEIWSSASLKKLLDRVMKELRVNPDRIYLTGWSLGGYGAWNMAESYPNLFAAAAPVSGGGDPELAHLIRDIPFWVFHGLQDVNVSPYQSMEMVQALQWAGADVKLTMYRDLAHDCWAETYGNRELYRWFLSNKRKPQTKK